MSSLIDRIGAHIEPEVVEQTDTAKIAEHLARLKPETITDDDGIDRTVYTYQIQGRDVRVIFYPPNELPVSENFFRGKRLQVVGDMPGWRTGDDWNAYLVKLQGLDSTAARRPGENLVNPMNFYGDNSSSDQETLMLVEQSPRALVDIAMATATSVNPDLARTRKLLADRKTTPEIDAMIDGIIATKILTADNEIQRPDASDTSAEALAVLALQGDTEAQALLDVKQKQLAEYDKENNIIDSNQPVEMSPTDRELLNKISTIHVTKYLPQESEDGNSWEIPTTFDANPTLRLPRITWHTTLFRRTGENSAARGSEKFANTPYAIMTRFGSCVEKNGKPLSFDYADTFYEISPGKRVRLSKEDSVLIKPGNPTSSGALIERSSDRHEMVYKHTGFTPGDIGKICGSNSEGLREIFIQAIRGEDSKFTISDDDVKYLLDQLGGTIDATYNPPHILFKHGDTTYSDLFLHKLENLDMSTVIESYLPISRFPGPSGDTLRGRCTNLLTSLFASRTKDMAMDSVSQEFREGFQIEGNQDLGQAVLRLKMRTSGISGHSNHGSTSHAGKASSTLSELKNGEKSQSDFHNNRLLLDELSSAERKMYYYLGLL